MGWRVRPRKHVSFPLTALPTEQWPIVAACGGPSVGWYPGILVLGERNAEMHGVCCFRATNGLVLNKKPNPVTSLSDSPRDGLYNTDMHHFAERCIPPKPWFRPAPQPCKNSTASTGLHPTSTTNSTTHYAGGSTSNVQKISSTTT